MEEPPSADAAVSRHIALLTESLALVPPAAVSAVVDCVLASAAISASHLFHSLLHAFPDPSEARQSTHILSHVSALCHLIKNTDAPPDALHLFISRVLVPQLEVIDPGDSELLNQIEALVCDVVSKTQSWELTGQTLVPLCLRSLGLCVGMVQNEGLDINRWNRGFGQGFMDSNSVALPLPTACHILTSLLESALRSGKEIQSMEQKLVDAFSPLDSFAENLIWDLSELALEFLVQSSETRSCAIRFLLPSVLSSLNAFGSVRVLVHSSPHTLSRSGFSRKIWKCCMSLFPLGHVERLDAYSILSLYFSSRHRKGQHNALLDNNDEEFDLRAQKEFWEEIRRGLVDRDPSMRKQALYILKISSIHSSSSLLGSEYDRCRSNDQEPIAVAMNGQIISCNGSEHVAVTRRGKWADKEAKSLGVGKVCHLYDHNLSSQERWKVFLLLYEMLEEYGTHLVEAAWNHQVSLLFQSSPLDTYMNPVTYGVYQVQMETVEGIFSWLAVLWERGLFHENPQVRCLIMQSLLDIDWEKYGKCGQKVPTSFVLGPLILGLNDVVHHKDFGVKGVYTSKTIQSATKYLCEFSRQLSLSERAAFVWSLASLARQEAFGRAGLMALACCIASAACQSSPHNGDDAPYIAGSSTDVERVESAQEKFSPCSTADLLDVLGIVIERSKQHFNPNYRLQVCEQVLKAASSLINICDVPADLLLHFLSTVPQEFTDCAGPLREMVRQWLTPINYKCSTFGSVNTETYSLENLIKFPASFVKHEPSPDVSVSFDDEDVDAWVLEAQRWARVVFLVITEEKLLEPIFMLLQNYCSSLCKPDLMMEWVPAKLLILILSLVDELQSERRKVICSTKARALAECDMAKLSDQFPSLVASIVCKNISGPFLLILDGLVSFAKLVSPIFWSTALVKDTHLPCSVKGKLGGPSQRRLASPTTSAVLQAILSIRTVACISSWCAQLKRDDCPDPSFAFLWDFSWKVIQSPNHYSETGAEICLAAYEALASAMKALSTTFTPVVFDFIMTYNMSLFPNEADRPLLDPLVLNFLNNINDLLANGRLTRSRRAVLMKWKWVCLDSLLSIPHNVTQNGVHQRSAYPLFSDSTLRSTFVDIVESLENAGESSVLSMLRSVRLILGLLHSGTSLIKSSCAGVNCQMMLQLVHSSWILHLSCNKRRVAPIAALLSAVLHHFVFSDLSMHEAIDRKQGPFKLFIEKLLDEGIRSPRTIRLAALHLTGLWLLYPQTVKYYMKELKLLSLYGSVAFDEDFEAELSENCEARMEVSLLAQSPDRELTEVFINTEMYARVSVAVLFYELAKLVNRRERHKIEDSLAALQCGKLFLLELLDSAVNDNDLSKELYKKYSGVHRRKVRAWQMLCILSHFVEKDIVEEVTSKLHICLYRNNLPAVRQYLETFAIHIYLKFPSLAEEQLIPIFYDYNMRPQALSSYVLIAANVILHASDLPIQMKHLNELLPPIIPFLTSHHHSLRGFTQLLVHYVLCKLWTTLRPTSSQGALLEMKCFDDLKSYLAENIDCVRLRASMEGFLDVFDPNTSATPAGIFKAFNKGSDFECVPISLMEQVIAFLNDVRDDLRSSISKDAMEIKNESLTFVDTCKDMEEAPNINPESISPLALKDLSMDFQKKITLHKHVRQTTNFYTDCFLGNTELSRLLLDMEKEDQLLNPVVQSRIQAMERIRGTQQQFILVASLLDRIPNLAGLVRTCEVFKAAGLAIADTSIVQDKQFQLISVTAEKWVPIIEVPVSSMKVFLQKKRREGFSILGLEQTANSTPLDQYSFPNKTVLVLGREKEGIPVDIIHVLDACVEIPQLGIIRSLNVHVSGAIALWEYTRQQRSKNI